MEKLVHIEKAGEAHILPAAASERIPVYTAFHGELPPAGADGYLRLIYFEQAGTCFCEYPEPVTVREGDLILVPGHVNMHFEGDTEISSFLTVGILTDKLDEELGILLLQRNPITSFFLQNQLTQEMQGSLVIRTAGDPLIFPLLCRMVGECEYPDDVGTLMQKACYSYLIGHLIRHHIADCERQISTLLSEEGYQIMLDIVRSDFKITLEDIAANHHIAPAYASRYVKKTTGMAFSQILANARDYVACLMLSGSARTIQAIAEQTGYENPENFVRAFKKRHGCTPTAYRQSEQSQ